MTKEEIKIECLRISASLQATAIAASKPFDGLDEAKKMYAWMTEEK